MTAGTVPLPPHLALTAAEGGRHGRAPAPRDVGAVLRHGSVAHGEAMVLRALARDDEDPARVAVVVSRKVGGAVQRNRARRRLRAALAELSLPTGLDFAVIARSPALVTPFADLVAQARALLSQVAERARRGR